MPTPYLVLALLFAPTAKELLDCSIAYHDPQGRWERGAFEITDQSTRPDGTGRRTVLRFDNARSRFEMEGSVDGRALVAVTRAIPINTRFPMTPSWALGRRLP